LFEGRLDPWNGRRERDRLSSAKDQEASTLTHRKAWERLLAMVYELDVMACTKCASRREVIAVILDPSEIRKIISCLTRQGRGPPTQERSRGNDAVHEDSGVTDGPSGCKCGFWISTLEQIGV
jgi:hypothetical protein